jgi:hypothetical protein
MRRVLREQRKKYTANYVKGINVHELVAFTAPISDKHKGGFNYDWKEFLSSVRLDWEQKGENAMDIVAV